MVFINFKKVRILIGIGIDLQTFKLIEDNEVTNIFTIEYKDQVKKYLITEMNNSEEIDFF